MGGNPGGIGYYSHHTISIAIATTAMIMIILLGSLFTISTGTAALQGLAPA